MCAYVPSLSLNKYKSSKNKSIVLVTQWHNDYHHDDFYVKFAESTMGSDISTIVLFKLF